MATIIVALSGMPVSMSLVRQILPQVAAAFKPFGITLNFVEGIDFGNTDPVSAGKFSSYTQSLLNSSTPSKSPAHLIATATPVGYDYGLNGSMLDYMRGISAVYTDAGIYSPNGCASRLDLLAQVCIHELGHMLDLTHGDASFGNYPSAMLPTSQRSSTWGPQHVAGIVQAWACAADEAQNNGEPPVSQQVPALIYPFNAQCRSNLRAASNIAGWWPYETVFRDTYQSGVEDSTRALSVGIVHSSSLVGVTLPGELYVTASLRNETTEVIELPAHLGPEFGSLRVEVEPEGEDPYWMQTLEAHCSDSRAAILPRQEVFRSFALVGNPARPLFRREGQHTVRLQIIDHQTPRAACRGSVAFPVEVVADCDAMIASRTLSKVLDRRTRPASARSMLRRLDLPGAPALLHSRVHAARGARSSADRATLGAIAQDTAAPVAVRHAAAIKAARYQVERGKDWRKIAQEYRPVFPSPIHDEFFETLQRVGVGWQRMTALSENT